MKFISIDQGDLGDGPLEDAVWELEHHLGEVIGKLDEIAGFAEKATGAALTRKQKQDLVLIHTTVSMLHNDSKTSYEGLRKFVETNRVEVS